MSIVEDSFEEKNKRRPSIVRGPNCGENWVKLAAEHAQVLILISSKSWIQRCGSHNDWTVLSGGQFQLELEASMDPNNEHKTCC